MGESDSVASIFNRIADSCILWNGSEQCDCYQKVNSTNNCTEFSPSNFIMRPTQLPSSTRPSNERPMGSLDTGNSSQEDRSTSAKNVYGETVFVQRLPDNYSNENGSYATKHRHRRRSQRDSPSKHIFRTQSDEDRSAYVISAEDMLRLAPKGRRDAHRTSLDRLVAYTAHGFQTCVSQVVNTAKKSSVPFVRELLNTGADHRTPSETARRKDVKAANFNAYLVENLTFFQSQLASFLSMQFNDIIRAYIPAQSKLTLKYLLQRHRSKNDKSKTSDLSGVRYRKSSLHSHNARHRRHRLNPVQDFDARHPSGTHSGWRGNNEKPYVDLESDTEKTKDSHKSVVGKDAFKHHNTIGDVDLKLTKEPHSTIYILASKDDVQDTQTHRQREDTRRSKRSADDSNNSQGPASGKGKGPVELSMRRAMHHSRELEIAHKLHYASVFVVSVLLIMVSNA